MRFVLFGTGDWGRWADPIFASLATGSRRALVVAAGQFENGLDAVESYTAGAAERLRRVGIEPVAVRVVTRSDAQSDDTVREVASVDFVYVLGGGPRCTVEALRGSALWRAVVDAGLPYVGSSGGAMLLGAWYPDDPGPGRKVPALGVFSQAVIAAHWNELNDIAPGLRSHFLREARELTLLGLDRDAGIDGDGYNWRAVGPGTVTTVVDGNVDTYRDGDSFELRMLG